MVTIFVIVLIQRQISARALMPPPRPSKKSFSGSSNDRRFGGSSSRKSKPTLRKPEMSTSSNTSNSIGHRKRGLSDPQTGNSDNISCNSDARKPRRKRRPKKKKQQVRHASSATHQFTQYSIVFCHCSTCILKWHWADRVAICCLMHTWCTND